MKKFLNKIVYINKFIFGWIIWILLFVTSIFFNFITWNWKETFTLNMKIVITEMLGESTWNIMTLSQ
jgi:hypothetical protein